MTIQDELRALSANLSSKRDDGNKHHQSNRYVRRPGARGPKVAPFGRGVFMPERKVEK